MLRKISFFPGACYRAVRTSTETNTNAVDTDTNAANTDTNTGNTDTKTSTNGADTDTETGTNAADTDIKTDTNIVGTGIKTDIRTKFTDTERKLLDCIRQDPGITLNEMAASSGLSKSGVRYALRELRNRGVLTREGSNRKGVWVIHE